MCYRSRDQTSPIPFLFFLFFFLLFNPGEAGYLLVLQVILLFLLIILIIILFLLFSVVFACIHTTAHDLAFHYQKMGSFNVSNDPTVCCACEGETRGSKSGTSNDSVD